MTGTSPQLRPHIFYVGILILITLWMSLPGIASMQVIDRDEARYAQATVQMVESGDYLNIQFQDRARNKKPAGIYWLQAASVKAFTDPGERKIWAHRIISVLGALLAVLATYWGALSVLGRRGAFWAGAILATSLLLTFEAHIAKTDAVLTGLSALCLACLLRLQRQDDSKTAFLFWAALALAIMIKGPIVPAIVIVALVTYMIWQKEMAWLRALVHVPGIIVALLIVIPWMVAIGMETNGAFFKEAFGGDLAPKIAGGQESHGALPGYYALTLPILFWPGVILLLPAIVFGFKASGKQSADLNLKRAIRLLICWILPFWIILELVPTKLPNYPLPLYPALAILCAGAFFALAAPAAMKVSRRLSAFLFLIVSVVLIIVLFAAEGLYADTTSLAFFVFPVFVALAFAALGFIWSGQAQKGLITALVLTGLCTPMTYQLILPRLNDLRISDRISQTMQAEAIKPDRIISPNFTEPSLVYALGTKILLGDKAEAAIQGNLAANDLILIDKNEAEDRHQILALKAKITEETLCLVEKGQVTGTNYSKGDPVEIDLYLIEDCPEPTPL